MFVLRIRDLGLAKQRFDSTQKPLARTILYFDALMMTACWISVNRQGQPEAQHADRFLKFVNEERVLQLAMAVDAGDESIQLTRFLDTEAYDIAELPMQLYLFFNKLNALFIDGRCVETGYTSHSLKIMKRARGYFIEGVPYTLGGAGLSDTSNYPGVSLQASVLRSTCFECRQCRISRLQHHHVLLHL